MLDIDPDDLAGARRSVERDAHGHLRIAEVNIGEILKAEVQKRLQRVRDQDDDRRQEHRLRAALRRPDPASTWSTRATSATAPPKYLLAGGNAAMISMQGGHFVPIPFAQMLDPQTGRTRVRLVDIHSTRYAIARRYMIRLRRDDFEDPHELAKFAATPGMSLEEFRDEFEYLIALEPPPLTVDHGEIVEAHAPRTEGRRPAAVLRGSLSPPRGSHLSLPLFSRSDPGARP